MLERNVMNLAVGVIIGAAFQSISNIQAVLLIRLLQWLRVALMEKALLLVVHFTMEGVVFDYGHFIAVINFLIMAFVLPLFKT